MNLKIWETIFFRNPQNFPEIVYISVIVWYLRLVLEVSPNVSQTLTNNSQPMAKNVHTSGWARNVPKIAKCIQHFESFPPIFLAGSNLVPLLTIVAWIDE